MATVWLSTSFKISSFCVHKKKDETFGLEQHEGEWMIPNFSFLSWTFLLTAWIQMVMVLCSTRKKEWRNFLEATYVGKPWCTLPQNCISRQGWERAGECWGRRAWAVDMRPYMSTHPGSPYRPTEHTNNISHERTSLKVFSLPLR